MGFRCESCNAEASLCDVVCPACAAYLPWGLYVEYATGVRKCRETHEQIRAFSESTYYLLCADINTEQWIDEVAWLLIEKMFIAAVEGNEGKELTSFMWRRIRIEINYGTFLLSEVATHFERNAEVFRAEGGRKRGVRPFTEQAKAVQYFDNCVRENVRMWRKKEEGATMAKRILPGDGCSKTCKKHAKFDWVPFELILMLGRTEQGGECMCVIVTR